MFERSYTHPTKAQGLSHDTLEKAYGTDLLPLKKSSRSVLESMTHWLTDAFLALHQQVTIPKHYDGKAEYQAYEQPLPAHWHLLVPETVCLSSLHPISHPDIAVGLVWEELATLLKKSTPPHPSDAFQQIFNSKAHYTHERQESQKLAYYWLEHLEVLESVSFHGIGWHQQQDIFAWPFCFDWMHAIHRRFPEATQHVTVHAAHLLSRLPELLKAPPLQLDIYLEGVTPSHYKIQTGKTYREVQKVFQPLWLKVTHFMQLWHKAQQHFQLASHATHIRIVTPVTQVSLQQYKSMIEQVAALGVQGLVFENTYHKHPELRQSHTLLHHDPQVQEALEAMQRYPSPIEITLPKLTSQKPRALRHCQAMGDTSASFPERTSNTAYPENPTQHIAMNVAQGGLSPCAMGRLFSEHQEVKFWHPDWQAHYSFQWLQSIHHRKVEAQSQDTPSACQDCPYNALP